MQIGKFSTK